MSGEKSTQKGSEQMSDTNTPTAEWLREEIEALKTRDVGTLNASMLPSYYSSDDEAKEVTMEYPLLDWEVNGIHTLHGGMGSTMLDLTMSMVVYAYTRTGVPPTISMTTNYLRPIPMGQGGTVLVRARLTSCGRKNATAYCELIIPESGKTAMTAIGTYAVIAPKA